MHERKPEIKDKLTLLPPDDRQKQRQTPWAVKGR